MANYEQHVKPKVLIVDDSELNRSMLSEILGSEYEIIEAENGAKAMAILQRDKMDISLVLLDIFMPVKDGYYVLGEMNRKGWIKDIPVIMISSDNSDESMNRCYDLGITEYISRPFNHNVVRHRAVNTIKLYAKQKSLTRMVNQQMREKEKTSSLMIDILSHIVEFRNGESGMHVLHVQQYTQILLRQLVQITDKYKLTEDDISMISKASALHDIGKISIADEILNKPGRFTKEEFEIMKTHSMIGASMLDELDRYKDEPLVKIAYEICRWHHERFDGRGYPDGLVGDEIPISAQIVSIADVYDALTSERVYKSAFTHEKAIEMILNGECGTFNPILLECLEKASELIKNGSPEHVMQKNNDDIDAHVHIRIKDIDSADEALHMLEYEKMKNSFYASISNDINFEYTASPPLLCFSPNSESIMGVSDLIAEPMSDPSVISLMSEESLDELRTRIKSTTPSEPKIEYECKMNFKGVPKPVKIICKSVWSLDGELSGAIGKVIELDN